MSCYFNTALERVPIESHPFLHTGRKISEMGQPISAFLGESEGVHEMEAQAFDDKSLQKTLGDLFGGEFLGGLHNLVSAALNELLGNTAAGEKEMKAFHVVYANNNILRVDYHMYKYDFSSKGLRDKMQNALCYVVQTSVLDLKKIDPQVVLYELDKSIGADNIKAATDKLHEEAKYMEELYKVINHLRVASMTPSSE